MEKKKKIQQQQKKSQLMSPALAGRFFTTAPTWGAQTHY